MPSVHHSIKKQKKRVYKEPNLYKLVFLYVNAITTFTRY